MPGLRQLHQTAAGGAVEPEFFAEDLLLPVGFLRCDNDRVAVGRNFTAVKLTELKNSSSVSLGLHLAVAKASKRTRGRQTALFVA